MLFSEKDTSECMNMRSRRHSLPLHLDS
jgi:hypothetical protein